MKYLLALLLVCAAATGFSQTSTPFIFKDTINHFSIVIPDGWHYGVSARYPGLKVIAYRDSGDTANPAHENLNLNILQKENSSLDKEYDKLISALSAGNDLNVVESGTITINGQPYKWFIDAHQKPAQLSNYVFLTYKEGKTYILTFTTVSESFSKYRSLFHDVAVTLVL